MNLIDRLNYSYKFVCDNSENVRINYSKIDEMIDQIRNSSVAYWLDSNPYGLMDIRNNGWILCNNVFNTKQV